MRDSEKIHADLRKNILKIAAKIRRRFKNLKFASKLEMNFRNY